MVLTSITVGNCDVVMNCGILWCLNECQNETRFNDRLEVDVFFIRKMLYLFYFITNSFPKAQAMLAVWH